MNYTELQKSIAEQQLGSARLTDIPKGTFAIALPSKEGDPIYLVGEKKSKFPIGLRSLAAMRIVTDASKVTVKTTREARDSENFNTLQNAIVNENLVISDATKFNVVGHLRVHDAGTDAQILKNEHYKGYPEYVKTTRKIAAKYPRNVVLTESQAAERNTAFTEATEALRASGAKSVPNDDKNYIMMPVFTVTN